MDEMERNHELHPQNHTEEEQQPEVMEQQVSMEEYASKRAEEERAQQQVVSHMQQAQSSQEQTQQPASSCGEATTAMQSQQPATERTPHSSGNDTYYKETVRKKKKSTSFRKVIAACLVLSVCGGLSVGTSYAWAEKYFSNPSKETASVAETGGAAADRAVTVGTQNGAMTAADVVEKVSPAVVNISVSSTGTTNYYGFLVPYESEESGSGVIFDTDEEYVYIVTNNHVVEGAKQISVSVTGVEAIEAEVVGTDAMAELAVVKAKIADFHTAGIDNITVAEFGDSDSLRVGDNVIAIGNALGQGKSATDGIISVLNKTIEVDGRDLDVMQTSANINPGNSGGALVNFQGQVVGINTAKSVDGEAMGYAIPSNTVTEVMYRLKDEGTKPRPYLGIMGQDITDEVADLYQLPVGVLVRDVLPGGGAEEAGLEPGDIIVSLAGQTVMTMDRLTEILAEQQVGTTVEMNVIRDGNTSVTLQVPIYDANQVSQ